MSDSHPVRTITVNRRETIPWTPGMTVSDLIDRMNFTFPRLVVSVNGIIVPYGSYATTKIEADADVRVVHLMAGG